jgi:hypothetical protein
VRWERRPEPNYQAITLLKRERLRVHRDNQKDHALALFTASLSDLLVCFFATVSIEGFFGYYLLDPSRFMYLIFCCFESACQFLSIIFCISMGLISGFLERSICFCYFLNFFAGLVSPVPIFCFLIYFIFLVSFTRGSFTSSSSYTRSLSSYTKKFYNFSFSVLSYISYNPYKLHAGHCISDIVINTYFNN